MKNWHFLYDNTLTIASKWEIFFARLNFVLNDTIPKLKTKVYKNKNKPTWVKNNPHLIQESIYLKNLFNYAKYKDPNLMKKYKFLWKKHKENIAEAEKNVNDEIIKNSNNKTKASWFVIQNHTNFKPKNNVNITHVKIENDIFNDKNDICNNINECFVNTAKKLLESQFSSNNITSLDPNLNLNKNINFSIIESIPDDIFLIIKSLPNKNTAGPDEITYKLAKYCNNVLSPILSILINESIKEGHFPKELKLSSIIPLHKSGNSNAIENLRPIARQSVFAKIFELFIQPQLYNYRISNNLFSPAQHGFVKGKSIVTATFDLLNPIYNALDNKKKCMGLFFDIKKAFDCLSPDIIIMELKKIGFRDNVLKLYESYLTDRCQYVELKFNEHNEINQVIKSKILP